MSNPKTNEANSAMHSLVLIGNIAAQWSNLEYRIAIVIWILLGLKEETGKIVTGGLDMLPRVNMAIKLSRHLKCPRNLIDTLVKIRMELQDSLQEERNRAMHGIQFSDSNGDLEVEVHRGKGGWNRRPLSISSLNQTGKRLHELSNELTEAIAKAAPKLREILLMMAKNIEETISLEVEN